MIQSPHVHFLSPMCLLDTRSGAALSVRPWLETIVRLKEDDTACIEATSAAFSARKFYELDRRRTAVLGFF